MPPRRVSLFVPCLVDLLYPQVGQAATLLLEDAGFLVDEVGIESLGGRWEGRVTYHDSCHGLRELGLTGQGRRLLGGIDGLELVEMAWPDRCCGFGGAFSVRLPDVATAMADDKLGQ